MPFQLDGNDAKLCNEVPDAQHMFFYSKLPIFGAFA